MNQDFYQELSFIDSRIQLMESMGGQGTWVLAFKRQAEFNARKRKGGDYIDKVDIST